jgi:hypothetical protein
VAGRYNGDWLDPRWVVSHPVVTRAEGPNDGLVAMSSASYGESCEVWDGDHVSLINWFNPLAGWCRPEQERTTHYGGLVRRLADEGF